MAEIQEGSKPIPDGASTAGAKVSAELFSDPKDFLETLRSHFSELSHGHENITLADLIDASTHSSDAKTRAAAQIAADPEHFKELAGIETQQDGFGRSHGSAISQDDLTFAQDMVDHKTFGYTATSVVRDVEVAVGETALGAAGTAVGISELTTGTSLLGGSAGLLLPLGWVGIGGAALVMAGYSGYKAFQESSKFQSLADQDSAMFKSWLSVQK